MAEPISTVVGTVVVTAIVTSAVEAIRNLLLEESKTTMGFNRAQIGRDLNTIHAFLIDADRRSVNSAAAQNWIGELIQLGTRAENLLLESDQGMNSQTGKFFDSLRRRACLAVTLHRVAIEARNINTDLNNLIARLEGISRGESSSSSQTQTRNELRITYQFETERNFVGMEDNLNRLVSFAKDEAQKPVLYVYGMGGLGKTSLARKLYNHEGLKFSFQAKAWVCVTREFSYKTVLCQILDGLVKSQNKTDYKTSDLGDYELVIKIHNFMMRSRSLIVLDDMWETEQWDILKKAFPVIENRCKIIITTRNKKLIPPLEGFPYGMDFLTEDQSWELVKKIILSTDPTQERETALASLEPVGREIVRKCSGVPLAVSAVGGILQPKRIQVDEWEMVREDIDLYLTRGEGVGENTRVKQILDLSYDSLPYDLKYCFLMLGFFKDYKNIVVDDLYMMWLGDDRITTRNRGNKESIKDIGGRYLGELISRSMVQFSEANPHTCILHDLMHSLCISKGRELNFARVLDGSQQRRFDDLRSSHVGRLSIFNLAGVQENQDDFIDQAENESLRFLSLRGRCSPRKDENPYTVDVQVFEKFKSLRTLILLDCTFKGKSLPERVGKLMHLKHLNIGGCLVEVIPKSIYDLPFLEIFNFSCTKSPSSGPVRVYNRFGRMKKLRHIFFSNYMQIVGGGRLALQGMENLETLHGFDSSQFWAKDIPTLTRLLELRAGLDDIVSLSAVTDCMSRLNKTFLVVEGCDFSVGEGPETLVKVLTIRSLVALTTVGAVISRFPAFQQGMGLKLNKLDLLDCGELEGADVLETLGMLPSLVSLFIDRIKVSNFLITFRAGSFRRLTDLSLSSITSLQKIVIEDGAMANLSVFRILKCLNLESIPDGIQFLKSLDCLNLQDMHTPFKDKLRVVGGECGLDMHKISHIPKVVFEGDWFFPE